MGGMLLLPGRPIFSRCEAERFSDGPVKRLRGGQRGLRKDAKQHGQHKRQHDSVDDHAAALAQAIENSQMHASNFDGPAPDCLRYQGSHGRGRAR
jgi:hypothetical protein